jgi:hypothetical protein
MSVDYQTLRTRLAELLYKYENHKDGTVQNVLHDLLKVLKDFAESETYEE